MSISFTDALGHAVQIRTTIDCTFIAQRETVGVYTEHNGTDCLVCSLDILSSQTILCFDIAPALSDHTSSNKNENIIVFAIVSTPDGRQFVAVWELTKTAAITSNPADLLKVVKSREFGLDNILAEEKSNLDGNPAAGDTSDNNILVSAAFAATTPNELLVWTASLAGSAPLHNQTQFHRLSRIDLESEKLMHSFELVEGKQHRSVQFMCTHGRLCVLSDDSVLLVPLEVDNGQIRHVESKNGSVLNVWNPLRESIEPDIKPLHQKNISFGSDASIEPQNREKIVTVDSENNAVAVWSVSGELLWSATKSEDLNGKEGKENMEEEEEESESFPSPFSCCFLDPDTLFVAYGNKNNGSAQCALVQLPDDDDDEEEEEEEEETSAKPEEKSSGLTRKIDESKRNDSEYDDNELYATNQQNNSERYAKEEEQQQQQQQDDDYTDDDDLYNVDLSDFEDEDDDDEEKEEEEEEEQARRKDDGLEEDENAAPWHHQNDKNQGTDPAISNKITKNNYHDQNELVLRIHIDQLEMDSSEYITEKTNLRFKCRLLALQQNDDGDGSSGDVVLRHDQNKMSIRALETKALDGVEGFVDLVWPLDEQREDLVGRVEVWSEQAWGGDTVCAGANIPLPLEEGTASALQKYVDLSDFFGNIHGSVNLTVSLVRMPRMLRKRNEEKETDIERIATNEEGGNSRDNSEDKNNYSFQNETGEPNIFPTQFGLRRKEENQFVSGDAASVVRTRVCAALEEQTGHDLKALARLTSSSVTIQRGVGDELGPEGMRTLVRLLRSHTRKTSNGSLRVLDALVQGGDSVVKHMLLSVCEHGDFGRMLEYNPETIEVESFGNNNHNNETAENQLNDEEIDLHNERDSSERASAEKSRALRRIVFFHIPEELRRRFTEDSIAQQQQQQQYFGESIKGCVGNISEDSFLEYLHEKVLADTPPRRFIRQEETKQMSSGLWWAWPSCLRPTGNSEIGDLRLSKADPHMLLLGIEFPVARDTKTNTKTRASEKVYISQKQGNPADARRLSALHSRFQVLADTAPPGQAPSRGSVSIQTLSSDALFTALLRDSKRTFGYLNSMGARFVTFEHVRSHDQFVCFSQAHSKNSPLSQQSDYYDSKGLNMLHVDESNMGILALGKSKRTEKVFLHEESVIVRGRNLHIRVSVNINNASLTFTATDTTSNSTYFAQLPGRDLNLQTITLDASNERDQHVLQSPQSTVANLLALNVESISELCNRLWINDNDFEHVCRSSLQRRRRSLAAAARSAVSQDASVEASVCVLNRSGRAVELYWVDYDGNELFHAVVRTGAKCVLSTWESHVWTARGCEKDDRKRLCFNGYSHFVVAGSVLGSQLVTIRPWPLKQQDEETKSQTVDLPNRRDTLEDYYARYVPSQLHKVGALELKYKNTEEQNFVLFSALFQKYGRHVNEAHKRSSFAGRLQINLGRMHWAGRVCIKDHVPTDAFVRLSVIPSGNFQQRDATCYATSHGRTATWPVGETEFELQVPQVCVEEVKNKFSKMVSQKVAPFLQLDVCARIPFELGNTWSDNTSTSTVDAESIQRHRIIGQVFIPIQDLDPVLPISRTVALLSPDQHVIANLTLALSYIPNNDNIRTKLDTQVRETGHRDFVSDVRQGQGNLLRIVLERTNVSEDKASATETMGKSGMKLHNNIGQTTRDSTAARSMLKHELTGVAHMWNSGERVACWDQLWGVCNQVLPVVPFEHREARQALTDTMQVAKLRVVSATAKDLGLSSTNERGVLGRKKLNNRTPVGRSSERLSKRMSKTFAPALSRRKEEACVLLWRACERFLKDTSFKTSRSQTKRQCGGKERLHHKESVHHSIAKETRNIHAYETEQRIAKAKNDAEAELNRQRIAQEEHREAVTQMLAERASINAQRKFQEEKEKEIEIQNEAEWYREEVRLRRHKEKENEKMKRKRQREQHDILRHAREAAEKSLRADKEFKRDLALKEREISLREMKERRMRIKTRQNAGNHMRYTGNGGINYVSDAIALPDHFSVPPESCNGSIVSDTEHFLFEDDERKKTKQKKKFYTQHPQKYSDVHWEEVLDWPDVKPMQLDFPSTALRREIRSARKNNRGLDPNIVQEMV